MIVGLAPGVELLGEYQGSGCTEAPFLIRRPDGRMLQVSRLLYIVATHLDGERSLDEVAHRARHEIDRPVSAASIAYLIDRKLGPLGILDTDGSPAGASRRSGAAALSLAARSAVLRPPAVRAVTGVLQPLFLPPVIAVALVTFGVVDSLFVLRQDIGRDIRQVTVSPAILLAVVAVTVAGALFHELGHATASRYGGAAPGVIGVGIYLLWPAFFNDLTDSYRLTRRGRLRADLGGVYFNVLFVLMLSAAFAVTRWAPLVVALVLQHIAMAQQFLPFVRLDGYYIVSDLAGVPDLFGRIRPILVSVLPGHAKGPVVADLRPRARAVVTVWVLTATPVLAACAAFLIASLPSIIAGTVLGLRTNASLLVRSLEGGAFGVALLTGIQLGILVIPAVGLTMVALRLVGAWVGGGTRRRPTAARAPTGSGPTSAGLGLVGSRRRLSLGGAVVLAYLCATTRRGNCERPDN